MILRYDTTQSWIKHLEKVRASDETLSAQQREQAITAATQVVINYLTETLRLSQPDAVYRTIAEFDELHSKSEQYADTFLQQTAEGTVTKLALSASEIRVLFESVTSRFLNEKVVQEMKGATEQAGLHAELQLLGALREMVDANLRPDANNYTEMLPSGDIQRVRALLAKALGEEYIKLADDACLQAAEKITPPSRRTDTAQITRVGENMRRALRSSRGSVPTLEFFTSSTKLQRVIETGDIKTLQALKDVINAWIDFRKKVINGKLAV